jgi:hypothetical protein
MRTPLPSSWSDPFHNIPDYDSKPAFKQWEIELLAGFPRRPNSDGCDAARLLRYALVPILAAASAQGLSPGVNRGPACFHADSHFGVIVFRAPSEIGYEVDLRVFYLLRFRRTRRKYKGPLTHWTGLLIFAA